MHRPRLAKHENNAFLHSDIASIFGKKLLKLKKLSFVNRIRHLEVIQVTFRKLVVSRPSKREKRKCAFGQIRESVRTKRPYENKDYYRNNVPHFKFTRLEYIKNYNFFLDKKNMNKINTSRV